MALGNAVQGGVEFGDFSSWAARMMCEPANDEFRSSDEDEDLDAGGWRRCKSRQYGGGAAGAQPAEEHPPPMSSVHLAPAEHSPVSWEYRRDDSTGIMVRMPVLLHMIRVARCYLS